MRKALIDRWQDTYHGITTSIYKYENGVRLVLSINPQTRYFDTHIVMRGGSYYESSLDVPRGTMHLLEHVMTGQPNKKFKTKKQIDEYLLGTRTRPSMQKNAFTGLDIIGFEGSIATAFCDRLLNFILFRLDYPEANLEKYIEEERQVVLTEAGSKTKPEESEGFQVEQFIRGSSYADLGEFTIGSDESIRNITSSDLHKCLNVIRNPHSTIITVQMPHRPTKHTQTLLDKLAEQPSGDATTKLSNPVIEHLTNAYRVGYFRDKSAREVGMSVYTLQQRPSDIDYKRSQANLFRRRLTGYVGTQLLRRELNLVYNFDYVMGRVLLHWNTHGLKTKFNLPIMPQVLSAIVTLLEGKFTDFLSSAKGKRWLNSQISDYIFPGNPTYDYHYAYNIGNEILDEEEFKFSYRQAYRIVKTTKVAEIIDNLHQNFLGLAPHIWFGSGYPAAEVLQVYQESDLNQYLKAKHGEPDIWLAPNAHPDYTG
jgi:hypothetical protein